MNAEAAWQATHGQLQIEMPRALFDAWVRDTRFLGWNERIFTAGVSNDYDWLDNWLQSTVDCLLAEMLNQSVSMHFMVDNRVGEDAGEEDGKSNDNSRLAQIASSGKLAAISRLYSQPKIKQQPVLNNPASRRVLSFCSSLLSYYSNHFHPCRRFPGG